MSARSVRVRRVRVFERVRGARVQQEGREPRDCGAGPCQREVASQTLSHQNVCDMHENA